MTRLVHLTLMVSMVTLVLALLSPLCVTAYICPKDNFECLPENIGASMACCGEDGYCGETCTRSEGCTWNCVSDAAYNKTSHQLSTRNAGSIPDDMTCQPNYDWCATPSRLCCIAKGETTLGKSTCKPSDSCDPAETFYNGPHKALPNPPSASDFAFPIRYMTIQSVGSTLCLDGRSSNPVKQVNCDASEFQLWYYNANTYQLQNYWATTCLNYNANQQPATLVACAPGGSVPSSQQWTYNPLTMHLQPYNSGLCLDNFMSSTASGNPIYVWNCGSAGNQQWKPSVPFFAPFAVKQTNSQYCWDLQSNSAGAIMVEQVCRNTMTQLFKYDELFRIVSWYNPGLCVQYNGDWQSITMSACTTNNNQKWSYNAKTLQWAFFYNLAQCIDGYTTPSAGHNIVTVACNTGPSQPFTITEQFAPHEAPGVGLSFILPSNIGEPPVVNQGLIASNVASAIGLYPRGFSYFLTLGNVDLDTNYLNARLAEIQGVYAGDYRLAMILNVKPMTNTGGAALDGYTLPDRVISQFANWVAYAIGQKVPIICRFGFEMNGNWFPYSNRPVEFKQTWQRVANAVRAVAGTQYFSMYFSPNAQPNGVTPTCGYTDPNFFQTCNPSGANFAALDTNGDFKLDNKDDPYLPYYPGDDYVDWVGLDFYDFGPMKLGNGLPDTSAIEYAIIGKDFYKNFAMARNKPVGFGESASTWYPNSFTGYNDLNNQMIKQTWWRALFDPKFLAKYPKIKFIEWFEFLKNEGTPIVLRDFRITADPNVLNAFKSDIANGVIGGISWH